MQRRDLGSGADVNAPLTREPFTGKTGLHFAAAAPCSNDADALLDVLLTWAPRRRSLSGVSCSSGPRA